MTGTNLNPMDSEICTMRIIFPVQSDGQAIEVKSKIKEALSHIENVQIDFRLISGQLQPPVSKNGIA